MSEVSFVSSQVKLQVKEILPEDLSMADIMKECRWAAWQRQLSKFSTTTKVLMIDGMMASTRLYDRPHSNQLFHDHSLPSHCFRSSIFGQEISQMPREKGCC